MPTESRLNLRQLVERGERPFPPHPVVARYFPSSKIETARRRLSRAIDRGDGPGLVIGPAGIGKSLLLQILATQYHERFDVVLLACSRICTRRALLQAILFELGLPHRLRDEGQLRLSLLDHLLSVDDCPSGLLLLVDEAQSLSVALLEELRVMTNMIRGGVPRVRVVLAGSPALEECFANPELESFSQRLAARCYLAPWGREETIQFVRAQLAASGAAAEILFAQDAWDALFEATDGVPRLVGQLCDRALSLADTEGRACIDRQTVQSAWSDLQQLPSPWETPTDAPATCPAEQVVEFGRLSADFLDEYPPADVEPTELDLELEVPAETDSKGKFSREIPVTLKRDSSPTSAAFTTEDPFAESFEEEEIVLDTFASWDDLFREDTPRVENRSDRDFANRIQSAIVTTISRTPTQTSSWSQDDNPAVDKLELIETRSTTTADWADKSLDVVVEDAPNEWPPLRLAVVNDVAPLKPIPLVAPSSAPFNLAGGVKTPSVPRGQATDDACIERLLDTSQRAAAASGKLALRSNPWSRGFASQPMSDEDSSPVLIIEDEATAVAPVNSPVRREEYRHLFSRLRSG